MEKVYTWIKTVSTLLIILSLIKNLLPGNSYNKYFDAFLGMLVVYVICSPLSSGYSISDVVLGEISFLEGEMESVYTDEELNAFSYSFASEEYERILKMQIAEIAENAGFDVTDVKVELVEAVDANNADGTYGEIKSVTITCSSADFSDEEATELCGGLADMLGIDEESIVCMY